MHAFSDLQLYSPPPGDAGHFRYPTEVMDGSEPYRSSNDPDAAPSFDCIESPHAGRRREISRCAPLAFVAFPLTFGTVGFFGYIALAIWLTPNTSSSQPVLSHGQQAFLISLPLCTLIATAIGFGFAFIIVRQKFVSLFLLLAIAFLGWIPTRSLWNNQIANYGRDPSEAVLYYPPTAYCAFSLILAVILGVSLFVSQPKSG